MRGLSLIALLLLLLLIGWVLAAAAVRALLTVAAAAVRAMHILTQRTQLKLLQLLLEIPLTQRKMSSWCSG
jgi:hypothetical protein